MSKRDYTISTSGGTTPSMTGQGTTLSAKLTDNGLEVWGKAEDMTATYMLTPTTSNDLLNHDSAYGQNTFKGDAHELLEALGNIQIQDDDPKTRSALRESIAFGNRILKQRFSEQVIAAYHSSDKSASTCTKQDDEVIRIICLTILDKALASKKATITLDLEALRHLVEVALCFQPHASLDGSDWLDLARHCLGKFWESR